MKKTIKKLKPREMIEALAKDCEITCEYVRNGKTCAIGCLALMAGIPEQRLLSQNSQCIAGLSEGLLEDLQEATGLTRFELSVLQRRNDSKPTSIEDRRRSVTEFIRERFGIEDC